MDSRYKHRDNGVLAYLDVHKEELEEKTGSFLEGSLRKQARSDFGQLPATWQWRYVDLYNPLKTRDKDWDDSWTRVQQDSSNRF